MTSNQKYQQLSYDDRRTKAIGRQQGLSIRAIARILNRPPSTISSEMARNQPGPNYSCHFAQQRCEHRRRLTCAAPKLVVGNALFEQVRTWLGLFWSPSKLLPTWLNYTRMTALYACVMKPLPAKLVG